MFVCRLYSLTSSPYYQKPGFLKKVAVFKFALLQGDPDANYTLTEAQSGLQFKAFY